MAAAAIGWYGPLIDLSRAAFHLDDFVQLLVFVHRSQPVQKSNASNGRSLLKINISYGDDTRSYFSVSLWQKNIGSTIAAGDIILLQNVKIVKYRNVLGAATVQVSSITVLAHFAELITCKDIDDLVAKSQFGERTRQKIRRVIHWVQHTESTFQNVQPRQKQSIKNWKEHVENKPQSLLSISEVLNINTSCNAMFYAYVGEISLPYTRRPDEVNKELWSLSNLLLTRASNRVIGDLICTGCKLCGSPMGFRSLLEQEKVPLYCQKNSNYLHEVCLIYRPFMLNLWDLHGQISLVVKTYAAEILFGNLTAENLYKSYQEKKNKIPYQECDTNMHHSIAGCASHTKISTVEPVYGNKKPKLTKQTDRNRAKKKINFYQVWLILIKLLLQQDKNNPFHFKVDVDGEQDIEDGRFELISLTMPCPGAFRVLS